MRYFFNMVSTAFIFCMIIFPGTAPAAGGDTCLDSGECVVYAVNKKVADFPIGDNFSTPEAANATFIRMQEGFNYESFRSVCASDIRKSLSPMPPDSFKMSPGYIEKELNSTIVEVEIFFKNHACVIRKLHEKGKAEVFQVRNFEFENGQWLNAGESMAVKSIEEARVTCVSGQVFPDFPSRPKISDPVKYLGPYVDYLAANGRNPEEFLMERFRAKLITIVGEVHHRKPYWEFLKSLVEKPEFIERIGVVYLELPSNDQFLAEKFLASEKYDAAPAIDILRDMMDDGWPDAQMLEFMAAVWRANRKLPIEKRVRIVLVDMPRPWKEIKSAKDWTKYDCDRNLLMAENIIADIKNHPGEKRNCLFITGSMHAALNLAYINGEEFKTAGFLLAKKFGRDSVSAIIEHGPVIANFGGMVKGRVALGLFDSAFAAAGNKKTAFSLDGGPFGETQFDAFAECLMVSRYRDGYDAYLFLGPYEYETASDPIKNFYDDGFMPEIARRYELMHGVKEFDKIRYIANVKNFWGIPRESWCPEKLGPIDAWKLGSGWKREIIRQKYEKAFENTSEVIVAAREIFDALRTADHNSFKDDRRPWTEYPTVGKYRVGSGYDEFIKWCARKFAKDPIISAEAGNVTKGENGQPVIFYKLTLKSGEILSGSLPLEYDPLTAKWIGVRGLDWHAGK